MKRSALLLLCWLLCAATRASLWPVGVGDLSQVLTAPGGFEPLPRVGASFWRDSVPESMRQSYVAYGERYLEGPWPALPMSVFAEFKKSGNRVNYESLCFERRRRLAALVMAEVVEARGRFVPAIVDGLGSLCEETWWGIPAHYNKNVPVRDDQTVDLFNAETAGLVAWAAYMLKPQLEDFSPLLLRRIASEIDRRILQPARTQKYWWKTAGMNWNPWICSNWLACVLLFETDRDRQLDAVAQVMKALDKFVDSYPADGGCDEGPGYWDRAAASLFECLRLLDMATGGRIDVHENAKVRAMAAYAYKTYIGNGYVLSFADSHENRSMQQVNILYPFGRYLGDRTMTQFARYIADGRDIMNQAARLYDKSGNFPTLGRELFFLRDIRAFEAETSRQPQLPSVWLPDLQIWTCRSVADKRNGRLFVAVKGGNNGESHNHNDVGQLVVYAATANGELEPLLIDMGVGEYTAKTFSKARYTIWTMQSGYHNLPQINGYDQHDGRQYGAKVVRQTGTTMTLDLAGAYPQEAAVSSWQRSVALWKSREVRVKEEYELTAFKAPSRLMFITTAEPSVTAPGVISLGCRRIEFDARQLSPAVEDISHLADPLLQGMWGQHMYRIVLSLQSKELKGTVSYSIK